MTNNEERMTYKYTIILRCCFSGQQKQIISLLHYIWIVVCIASMQFCVFWKNWRHSKGFLNSPQQNINHPGSGVINKSGQCF